MPGMDGIEATRRIVGQGGDRTPRVLILTTFDGDGYVYDALRAGASGFLLKDVPADQLVDGVRVVARGDSLLPLGDRRLIEDFSRSPRARRDESPELSELTPRELEVLGLIARGLSNGEIAQRLVVSETTVKTHVRPGCSPSSTCATARRPCSWPTSRGWSAPATRPASSSASSRRPTPGQLATA